LILTFNLLRLQSQELLRRHAFHHLIRAKFFHSTIITIATTHEQRISLVLCFHLCDE